MREIVMEEVIDMSELMPGCVEVQLRRQIDSDVLVRAIRALLNSQRRPQLWVRRPELVLDLAIDDKNPSRPDDSPAAAIAGIRLRTWLPSLGFGIMIPPEHIRGTFDRVIIQPTAHEAPPLRTFEYVGMDTEAARMVTPEDARKRFIDALLAKLAEA